MSSPVPQVIPEAIAERLSGTTDEHTNMTYIPLGSSHNSVPKLGVWLMRFQRLVQMLLDTHLGKVVRTDDGPINVGCYPFRVPYADGDIIPIEGNDNHALDDGDGTYYVFVDRTVKPPVLSHDTQWPVARDDYIPLAIYEVANGVIVTSDDEADARSIAVYGGFLSQTAGDGTTSETFTLDSDNVGAAAAVKLLFNRGSDGDPSSLAWNETAGRFDVLEDDTAGEPAAINVKEVVIDGAVMLTDAGAAMVAASTAGAGLTHAAGALDVNVDDATIAIGGSGLQLKNGGISVSKLGDTLADKLVQISISDSSGASPRSVVIQALDIQGNALIETIYLTVRVCDDADGKDLATNAAIAVGAAGELLESIVSGKVLRVKTNSNGTLIITLTNGLSETSYILAEPTARSRIMDCSDYGTVTIT